MSEIEEWLNITKQENPELNDFITSLDGYFSETGFDASEYEKAVDADLKSLKGQIKKLLEDDEHAQD